MEKDEDDAENSQALIANHSGPSCRQSGVILGFRDNKLCPVHPDWF